MGGRAHCVETPKNELQYGTVTGWRVRWWVVALVVLGSLLFLSSQIPVHRIRRTRICLVCGQRESTYSVGVAGKKVWQETKVEPWYSECADLANVPHQHQWAIAGITSAHGTPWVHGGGGCGGPSTEAAIAMQAVEIMLTDCGKLSTESRRQIFPELTKFKSREELYGRGPKLIYEARRRERLKATTSLSPS